jgi:hypothetical protein
MRAMNRPSSRALSFVLLAFAACAAPPDDQGSPSGAAGSPLTALEGPSPGTSPILARCALPCARFKVHIGQCLNGWYCDGTCLEYDPKTCSGTSSSKGGGGSSGSSGSSGDAPPDPSTDQTATCILDCVAAATSGSSGNGEDDATQYCTQACGAQSGSVKPLPHHPVVPTKKPPTPF